MEPANDDRHAGGAQCPRKIERARILVRLHPDQPDETTVGCADLPDRVFDVDDGVALVERVDFDIDIGPKHAPGGAFGKQPVNAREAVGGNGRAPPLDHVTVGIVMRRLDQDDFEDPVPHVRRQSPADSESHLTGNPTQSQPAQRLKLSNGVEPSARKRTPYRR